MYDVTSPSHYIAEESGSLSSTSAPYEVGSIPLASFYYDQGTYCTEPIYMYYEYNEFIPPDPDAVFGYVLFNLVQETEITQFVLTSLSELMAVTLVASDGTTLVLYATGWGDVYRTSRVRGDYIDIDGGSYRKVDLTWDFSSFPVKQIILGLGDSNYSNERFMTTFAMQTDADFPSIASRFWRNFNGQTETI